MEAVFGTSFSDVRVHVGPQAQQIGAVAFTLGSNLYFAPGQYNPNSQHGQRLIGHELAHVVQQRAGRVRNPFGSGVAVVQDPGLEVEADRMGLRAAQAPMPVQAKAQGQPPQRTRPGGAPHAPGAAQQQPHAAPGGRPMAPHVQAAVAQAKPVTAPGQAQQLTTGGRPQVIQGKFTGGFAGLSQRCRQAGVLQPKMSNTALQLPPALASFPRRGGGVPLPVLVQRKMEAVFGTSFAEVRIHEGPEAQQLGAQAFTMGTHIYFAPGQYNPNTAQGQRLLGQELTHVVQQRAGRVRNPYGAGVAVVHEAGLEAEADRMATRAAQALTRARAASQPPSPPDPTRPAVARTLQASNVNANVESIIQKLPFKDTRKRLRKSVERVIGEKEVWISIFGGCGDGRNCNSGPMDRRGSTSGGSDIRTSTSRHHGSPGNLGPMGGPAGGKRHQGISREHG